MPKIKIIYQDSDGIDKAFELGFDPVTIGRATECELNTQDAMVSRKHARLVWDGAYCWIEDLGSSNGVYVGREKVQRAPFGPGDIVTCGSMVLRMAVDTQPVMAAVPVPEAEPAPAPVVMPEPAMAPTTSPDLPAYVPPPASSGPDPLLVAELAGERQQREQAQARVTGLEAEVHRLQAAAIADSGERVARQAAEAERDRMEQRFAALQEEIAADRARFQERLATAQAEMEIAQGRAKEDPEKVTQIVELTAQVNRLRLDTARLEDVEAARKAAVIEAEVLKGKLGDAEQAQREVKELRAEVRESHDLRRAAEEERLSLAAKIQELSAPKVDSEKEELAQQVRDLKAELRENQDLRRGAEEERANLAAKIDDMEGQLRLAASPKVDHEKESLKEERARLEARLAGLEEDLKKASQPGEDPEKAHLQRLVDEMMAESDKLRAEVAKLDAAHKEAEGDRDRLRNRAEALEAELAAPPKSDPEKERLAHRVEEIEAQLKEARHELESAQLASTSGDSQARDLMQKLHESNAQLHEAETQLGELTAKARENEAKAHDAEAKAHDAEAKLHDAEAKAHDVEAKLHDAEAKAHDVEAKLHDAEKRAGDAETKAHDAEAKAHDAEAKLHDAETKAHDAEAKLHDAEKRAGDAEAQAHAAAANAGDSHGLTQQLAEVRADAERAHSQLAAAREEAEQAVADLRAARREGEELHKELEAAKAASSSGDSRLHDLEAKLHDTEARAREAETRASDAETRAMSAEAKAHSAPVAAAGGGAGPEAASAAVALGDALAELRTSLRAASDEATVLPGDQVQVLADALSSATGQLENARAHLRQLGKLVGAE